MSPSTRVAPDTPVHPISERGEAVRESEEKYRLLFDAAGDAIFVLDEEGRILEVNSRAVERYGYSSEELMTMTIRDVDAPEERPRVPERINETLREGHHSFEAQHLRKDGSLLPVDVSARRVVWEGRAAIMALCRDVSERKRMESALRESEARYRALYEEAAVGIFHSTFEGRFLDVNPAFARMLGYDSPREVVEAVHDIAREVYVSPPERDDSLARLLSEGRTVQEENRFRRKDGTEWEASLHLRYVRDASGRPAYVEGFIEDVTERKRVDAALRESEARFHTIYDMEPECVKILGADCTLTAMNPAGLSMIEADSLEMVKGQSVLPIVDADFREAFRRLTEDVCRRGASGKLEFRMTGLKGTPRWLETHAVPLRDAEGRIIGLLGVTRDITEQKGAIEALQATNAKLQTLIEVSPLAITLLDPGGNVRIWNPAAERMFGWAAGEVLGRLNPIVQPSKQGEYQTLAARLVRGEVLSSFETVRQRKDGSLIDVSISSALLLDADGKIAGRMAIIADISERRRAEEALQKSQMRFSTVFRASPIGIAITRPDGIITDANATLCELLGYSAEELVGHGALDLRLWVRPAQRDEVMRALRSEGKARDFEVELRRKSGEILTVVLSLEPIDLNGEQCTLALVMDITERKRAEERVATLLREKEVLLREVHHRIKNNMNTMGSLLHLQSRTQTDPSARMALEDAEARLKSMGVLYDKLYRSETFGAISVRDYFPPLLSEIVAIFPNRRDVTLRHELDDVVLAPKLLYPLGIVLNELITNAMKYAFQGRARGEIRVAVARDGDAVRVEFEDDGVGLPEGFRIEQSAGFGMKLVGLLVEQLRGSIAIEGGKGTRFVIRFRPTDAM